MKKVNLRDIPVENWSSPKGNFSSTDQEISVALGREPLSTDLTRRHPFDVDLCRIPPGRAACPYHSHSAQWEYYQVLAGRGTVRHAGGDTAIAPGDCFLFAPGEPHQLRAAVDEELQVLIVADNPLGESCHYPDSDKWLVRSPERRLIRSTPLDYLDGEE
ncbi:MAG: cupin domain-containing protein [Opitutaceae bacterium]